MADLGLGVSDAKQNHGFAEAEPNLVDAGDVDHPHAIAWAEFVEAITRGVRQGE